MTTEVTTTGGVAPQSPVLQLDRAKLDLLKRTIATGLTDDEFQLLVAQSERLGLDPLSRQIYGLKIGGKMSITASIDGLRLVAQRSGEYDGQAAPMWCGKDGKWVDVWLHDEPPAAARVGVYRRGAREATVAVARYDSYKGSSPVWKSMPDVMLSKCAEALALRKAFPAELSGVYSSEELDQAVAPVPSTPVTAEVATTPRVVRQTDRGSITDEQAKELGRKWGARYRLVHDVDEVDWQPLNDIVKSVAGVDRSFKIPAGKYQSVLDAVAAYGDSAQQVETVEATVVGGNDDDIAF